MTWAVIDTVACVTAAALAGRRAGAAWIARRRDPLERLYRRPARTPRRTR